MKGVSELAARLDGLLVGELDWPRLGDTELVRDLYCSSVLRLFFAFRILLKISFNLGGDPIEFLLALRPLARLLQQKQLAGGEPPTTISHFSRTTNHYVATFKNHQPLCRIFQGPPTICRILKRNSPVCRLHQPVG